MDSPRDALGAKRKARILMHLTARDVPKENLFMVGVVQRHTSRDFLVIRRPRAPFVISRAEALNIIGYMITHADFRVADVENAINDFTPEQVFFKIDCDEMRVLLDPLTCNPLAPPEDRFRWSMCLFTLEEAKIICAALVHGMKLHPSELDAGVVAIFEHARNLDGTGQALEDILKISPN